MDKLNKKIQAASHSGAKLNLNRRDGRFVVTKVIYDSIARANNSLTKQAQFNEMRTGAYNICSVPVSDISRQPDCLEFTMPFIDGIGGDVITYKGNKSVADSLRVTLNAYLLNVLSMGKEEVVLGDKFSEKLQEIKAKYTGSSLVVPLAIDKAYELAQHNFIFPMGDCHGDLTLSNIKVTQDNKLFLFDFLEGFIETPLQDVVKLKQDFDYGWSFRHEKKNLALKGKMFCESAYPDMISTISRLYKSEVELLELINLLRIAPYIKSTDEITQNWLDNALSKNIHSN
ncbi:phosphotransferase [Vibrio superstes]|uniref:Aminoglycoside phosphotransferase domain-containing protein n=1 Tax=Vibrio superstes NBRC 103154 TaxID=1219062 RepID=A0A511QLG0_9VIBR|nr:phosphotransferase [Vibrio superstes]GEM78164.1 hypothetical protein VSU01S_04090 [Vibrio superstes NBRC 103154]